MGHYRGKTLPWWWRWGLWQIYCRVGIGWRWWAAEVCHHCVLALPARVSPPHRRFTSLSFASIYESRVRSSQVLPFRSTTALLGILKDHSWKRIGYTKSVLFFFSSFSPFYFFFIELWRIYGSDLIWCITFGGALVLHVSDIVQHLSVCLFGELAGSRACCEMLHAS